MSLIRINPADNVAVDTETGHKQALCDISSGESVIKYGFCIGKATCDIKKGERVHTNNLKTALHQREEYSYEPVKISENKREPVMIEAYVRKDGSVGIRNEIWIIPTVA